MENISFDTAAMLGWLFESTLYISIFICVILVLKAITRGKLPAWWSYGLWLLLVLRMFVPWGIKSPLSIFNFFPAPPGDDVYIPFLMEQVVSLPLVENTSNILSLDKLLLLVWFAGILFFSISSLLKNLRFWVVIKRIVPVADKTVIDLFDVCRRMLTVRRNVAIVVTDRVKSPALFGYLKPRLLLPPGFLNSLGKDELRCVFLHELGHMKGHDIGISWLVNVLQVIHWFNPFVWYAFHNMRIDQEVACDAYVLSRIKHVNPADYANTIVDILERFVQNRQLPSLAGIIENKSQIKRRIAMIMNYKKFTHKITTVSILMLFAVGLVFFTSSSGLSGENGQNDGIYTMDNPANDDPFTMAEIDQPPRPVFTVPPKYPALAKEDKTEGKVVVQLVIDSRGYPQEPIVASSEPEGVFDESALNAVAEYRFQPALKDGKPVACIVKIPIKFSLD